MKNLIIHAGPHKTGTTYIQGLLHNNKDLLQASSISYPDAYYLFLGHHYLCNALNGNETIEAIREKIESSVGSATTCILSSENFIFLTDKGMKKLKEIFPSVTIRFVLFSRRPSLRLISRWHEEVKQGGSESLESYLVKHIIRPMQSTELNIVNYIKKVESIFGKNVCYLADYESASKNKNVMAVFQKAADIDVDIADTSTIVNKMTPLGEIEVIRGINLVAGKNGVLKGSNIREAYYELVKQDESFQIACSDLISKIDERSHSLDIGNTGFDITIAEILKNNYASQIVNEISTPERKTIDYPSTEWSMDPELQDAFRIISDYVIESL
ncbi:hypothetical protein [Cobetia sp. MC34]|uniref:hypothetical protein n=1 Tax=Cobetia sp. MC34 TaxID=2785080 RepID=UPI001BCA402E|nr:hypothetical protein [Cobetia sp. MC34]MBS4154770.1 hypothetical protein [Cobetia sp. MC34]